MNFEYVRQHYNVPAEIGRRVLVDGQPGIISTDEGHYLGVNFDDDKPGHISRCHPTWRVEYAEMSKVRPVTKSQQRYKRFLELGESFGSFIDFCRWDAQPEHPWNHQPTQTPNQENAMSDTLTNRLRGIYEVGPNGEFGKRSFADFVPAISLEAASRIEELESLITITSKVNGEKIKDIATEFFRHWYNYPGTNTDQGFDSWWEINEERFGA